MENIAIARKPAFFEALRWRLRRLRERLFPQPSNLERHAEHELRLAGIFDKDADYDGMLGEAVMDLVRAHCKRGHSGGSHQRVLELFNIVVNYKTLLPLTDDPAEWIDIGELHGGKGWQNTRQSSCFSASGGKTYYDIDDNANYLPRDADGWRSAKPFAEWKIYAAAPSNLPNPFRKQEK